MYLKATQESSMLTSYYMVKQHLQHLFSLTRRAAFFVLKRSAVNAEKSRLHMYPHLL